MSLIRHVAFWEPHSGRFEGAETGNGNFPSTVCAEARRSVAHTERVASSLPAAVAGWCLRCLLWGLCPRYSSAWLWVSQSKPFVYSDRMHWLLTWKKCPRRPVLYRRGRPVMYRLLLGPFMELLLETRRNPSLRTSCAFFSPLPHPTIHLSLPQVQTALSSRIVGCVFVTDSPVPSPPSPVAEVIHHYCHGGNACGWEQRSMTSSFKWTSLDWLFFVKDPFRK